MQQQQQQQWQVCPRIRMLWVWESLQGWLVSLLLPPGIWRLLLPWLLVAEWLKMHPVRMLEAHQIPLLLLLLPRRGRAVRLQQQQEQRLVSLMGLLGKQGVAIWHRLCCHPLCYVTAAAAAAAAPMVLLAALLKPPPTAAAAGQ